ncbi:MAG: SHOCT domain-containing protein, partial [Chloroflexi bacterium]|nr:SHOCT domain-containing protein [Chloroflexota bacterium]
RRLVRIAMLAIIVLFLVAVIVGIVLLVRWAVRSGGGAAPVHREDAIEILRRRYAAGEISKEEFDQKKRDITGT